MPPPPSLRLLPASFLAALCLSSCSLEPISFWMDTPKAETDLTEVAAAPVPKLPGYETGLNVTFIAGYVRTPFTHPPRLVDARGLQAGTLVVCPFTQKFFYLPLDFVYASPGPGSRQSAMRAPVARRAPVQQVPPPPLAPVPASAARASNEPEGIAVPGRPGFVYSPYADRGHMVDVTGLAAGMEVRCPYTGKIFRVPAMR